MLIGYYNTKIIYTTINLGVGIRNRYPITDLPFILVNIIISTFKITTLFCRDKVKYQ